MRVPVGTRYDSVYDIPEDIRPIVAPRPVEAFPVERGRKPPAPRRARDESVYFCLSCETVVASAQQSFCATCNTERETGQRQSTRVARKRAGQDLTRVGVPIGVLNDLLERTYKFDALVGAATREFDRAHMTGGAIDRLMLGTKDYVRYIEATFLEDVQKANKRIQEHLASQESTDH